jgi:hypothetical protein
MTARPLIGVTIGPEAEGSGYLRLRSTYPRAIEQAGGVPVLIPPLRDASLRDLLEKLDGLVLPGGADVDPAYYGEARQERTDVNAGLDALELSVARWALASDVPTLGICRGQQVLNVAAGGKLVQHIDQHRQGEPRDRLTHALDCARLPGRPTASSRPLRARPTRGSWPSSSTPKIWSPSTRRASACSRPSSRLAPRRPGPPFGLSRSGGPPWPYHPGSGV